MSRERQLKLFKSLICVLLQLILFRPGLFCWPKADVYIAEVCGTMSQARLFLSIHLLRLLMEHANIYWKTDMAKPIKS